MSITFYPRDVGQELMILCVTVKIVWPLGYFQCSEYILYINKAAKRLFQRNGDNYDAFPVIYLHHCGSEEIPPLQQ